MRWTRCSVVLALFAMSLIVRVSRSEDVTVEENVTYGKGGTTELKLDLARPIGDGPFPAIVFIHGGGWYQGNRQVYKEEIREAAKRGYVAATISYRLMQFDEDKKETTTAEPIFPAQVHDAKAAIRWLRANAEKYSVDPGRIGVTGASAGGYLSLLIGLTEGEPSLKGDGGDPDQSSRVQAVVNFFGPTDTVTCYKETVMPWICRLFMGGTPQERPKTYKTASPITYVGSDDPPVLTLHGDQDALVPLSQAKMLDEKMKEAGADHTLIVFEGEGHGFGSDNQRRAMQAMWDFFDQHLKL
jgi:acetyl esterase/lipase